MRFLRRLALTWKMTIALESGLAAKRGCSLHVQVLYIRFGSDVDEGNDKPLSPHCSNKFLLLLRLNYHLCQVLSAMYGSIYCLYEREW